MVFADSITGVPLINSQSLHSEEGTQYQQPPHQFGGSYWLEKWVTVFVYTEIMEGDMSHLSHAYAKGMWKLIIETKPQSSKLPMEALRCPILSFSQRS